MTTKLTPARIRPYDEPALERGLQAASALPCQETLKRPEGRAPVLHLQLKGAI